MGKRKGKSKVDIVSQKSKELPSEGRNSLLKPEPKIKKPSPNQSIMKKNISTKTPVEEKKTEEKNNDDEKHKEKQTEEKNNDDEKHKEKQKENSISGKKEKEKDQKDYKSKEKLGGVIFMCNAKTKPDCFRYMVMGYPEGKKELVMSIKPDLKLFLYDYDAKLLYGIFKASSPGGLRLEPAAFNGSFTAQVRFKVDQECAPLTTSIFCNAIKENYDAKKNMLFRTDLTLQQVGRLIELFRQQLVQSIPQALVPSVPYVPILAMPPRPALPAEGKSHLHQGLVDRAQHAPQILKETPMVAASRGHLLISEKDYRTYGLLQKPPAPTSASLPATNPPAPVLNPYNIRQATYHPYPYHATSSDPYAAAHLPLGDPRFCDVSGRAGSLAHGSSVSIDKYRMDTTERLSSTHAGNALADYNRRLQQPSGNSDLASLPVSSRYSFAGPTLSYR